MTKIYIIRHGEAEGNIYRRIHGHYDGRITLTGLKQIEALRERFLDVPLDAVYSSDLTRAYQTSLAVSEPKNMSTIKLPGLREMGFGVWEDTCWGWWEMFEPELMRQYNIEPTDWHVDGSESIKFVQQRMVETVRELAEKHDGESIACVTHGVALRTLLCHASGIELESANDIPFCDNTAVSLLSYDDGKFSIEYMNDNSHLPVEISTFAKQNWWKNKDVTDKRNLYFEPLELDADGQLYYEAADRDLWDIDFEGTTYHGDVSFPGWHWRMRHCVQFSVMHYGKRCGIVSLNPKMSDKDRPNAGWVSLLYLEPEFRGNGYAIQLLGQTISYYKGLGRDKLILQVSEKNSAAIKFYERTGFYRYTDWDFTSPFGGRVRFLGMELDI